MKMFNFTCKFCNNIFSRAQNCYKFCSKKCASDYRKNEVPYNVGVFTVSKVITCLNCRSLFRSYRKNNGVHTKYCSSKCSSFYRNKGKEIFLSCIICMKKIRTTIGFLKYGKKYCSRECAGSWKGGITPLHVKLRTSTKYKHWRKEVFERDKYTCQVCRIHGGYLQAHHIKQFAKYPELIFDVNNGQTLCLPCHKKTDTWRRPKKHPPDRN